MRLPDWRYEQIKEIVSTLLSNRIRSIPVDVFLLAKSLNINLVPYSKLREYEIMQLRRIPAVAIKDGFCVYRNMSLAMQIFQIYKSRAIGNFLMQKEIPIIPNVRWGDERSYDFCFEGIEKHSVIAVGVLGGLKNADDRKYFIAGFYEMLARLEPDTILCYGNIPDELAIECKNKNIVIKEFKTEIAISHAKDEKKQFLFGL